MIVIVAESNPRIAALMRVDIQATMPDARVLVARPIAFDIGSFARQLVQRIGQSDLDITEMIEKFNELKAAKGVEQLTLEDSAGLIDPFIASFKPTLLAFKNAKLPA